MVELPIGELAAGADAIVRGQVVRTGTRVALVNGVIEPRTHTWIEVTSWLAGARARRTIELWEPGGRYGGGAHGNDGNENNPGGASHGERWEETSGTPRYRVGDEVVVFLREDPERPGRFRTHEMAQGKFRLLGAPGGLRALAPGKRARGVTAVRDLDDVSFASWTSRGMALEPAVPAVLLPLDDLLAQIRAGLAARARGPARAGTSRVSNTTAAKSSTISNGGVAR
jgi:hypothetical protein